MNARPHLGWAAAGAVAVGLAGAVVLPRPRPPVGPVVSATMVEVVRYLGAEDDAAPGECAEIVRQPNGLACVRVVNLP